MNERLACDLFNLSDSSDSTINLVVETVNGEQVGVVYVNGKPRHYLDPEINNRLFEKRNDRFITEPEARYRLEQAGLYIEPSGD